MKIKKILGAVLACALVFGSMTSFAYSGQPIDRNNLDAVTGTKQVTNNQGTSEVVVTSEGRQMTVTVPMYLPAYFDSNGQGYFASNASITNNSSDAVRVTNITATGKGTWRNSMDGENTFQFMIDGMTVPDVGQSWSGAFGNNIMSGSSATINYSLTLGSYKASMQNEAIADVVFTIDWM